MRRDDIEDFKVWLAHKPCANDGSVIAQPVRGLSSNDRPPSVTENANSVLPTSTATTTVKDVTGAA